MANTTNFGWETPDDTDLVKDGAAAMRTLGNSIDTSLVDLKGGTTGQVLSKASNTDLDFSWVAQDDSNAIQNAIVDAKGDLISATAADTPARLAVGTNGQVLTADSSTSTGLKWATAAASSGPAFRVYKSANQTVTAGTFTKVTFNTETFDTDNCFASDKFTPNKEGYYQINATVQTSGSGALTAGFICIYKNGSRALDIDYRTASVPGMGATGGSVFYANGTTDYFEVYVNLTTASGGEVVSGVDDYRTNFNGVWIRG